MASSKTRTDRALFHFVMIKPTHYDDDGYPIQWFRSAIPSNTLACLNGLARGRAAARGARPRRRNPACTPMTKPIAACGPTVSSARSARPGGRALIGFVGVQSNQFPRAVDLARPFLAAGLPVCIGGFHVSGCIAMLPEMPPEMREAQELGISFFAGEAEDGRLDAVLARRLERNAGAALQLHERPAGAEGTAAADPAAEARAADIRHGVEHRSRPRLSLPVLVLHHHQRPGPQEPGALGRRSRARRPGELRAGHQAVLHHRRQSRAQQPMGIAVRPHDQDEGRRGHGHRLHHPGRYALPQDPELHREGDQGRRAPRSSSGWRTSIPTI